MGDPFDPHHWSADDVAHPYTQAAVIAAALAQGGCGVLPSRTPEDDTPVWPIYASHMPPTPDNAICVYDTTGYGDGRLQASGETVRHPGWQVKIRARTYLVGAAKMKCVQRLLDTMRRLQVVVGTDAYMIHAVKQTSDVIHMGQEEDADKRELFTLNGTITLEELTNG